MLGPNLDSSMVAQPVLIYRLNRCHRYASMAQQSTAEAETEVRPLDLPIVRAAAASLLWAAGNGSHRLLRGEAHLDRQLRA